MGNVKGRIVAKGAKAIINVFLIMLLVSNLLISQQGNYIKKSVSALTDLYIFNGAEKDSKVDKEQFDKLFNEQIKMPRFDYVALPKVISADLLSDLNNTSNLNSIIITTKINEIVLPSIVEILNDDVVKELRSSNVKSKISEQTMAGSKAKSKGLTREDLGVLMNSAYFYFPYISTNSPNEIAGGILWYKLNIDKNNVPSITLVSTVEANAEGANSTVLRENPFTKIQEPYNGVLSTFMKNLSVQTRKIEDFRITAQVAEIVSSKKFTAPVGIAQGIYLDNGFDIINYTEDEQGNTVVNNIGFGRIDKNAYAKGENATIFRYIGNSPTEGDIVRERPNFGIDAKVKFGFKSGLDILKKHSVIFNFDDVKTILSGQDLDYFIESIEEAAKDPSSDNGFALTENATSAVGFDVSLEYNLAPVVKISQLFFAFDAGFYVPTAKPNLETGAFTYIIPIKSSILKKFWLGRMNINASIGGGVDMFNISGTKLQVQEGIYLPAEWELSTISPSIDFKGSFEYLINPDLAFTFAAGYTLAMQPISVTYTIDEVEPLDLTVNLFDNYSSLKLGGISISAGVTYTLPKLDLDWFDFLDKLKKY